MPNLQSTYLAGFWEDARLRRYWEAGVLEYVLWDSTSECVGHLKCMQPLMYSHSILAHWGQPVYLSFADHDEYLSLNNPDKYSSVQDLVPQCFDGLTQVRAVPSSNFHTSGLEVKIPTRMAHVPRCTPLLSKLTACSSAPC